MKGTIIQVSMGIDNGWIHVKIANLPEIKDSRDNMMHQMKGAMVSGEVLMKGEQPIWSEADLTMNPSEWEKLNLKVGDTIEIGITKTDKITA